MAWVRTDDNAPNHPKFFRAGVAAAGFWWGGLCYANRNLTDGFIPASDLKLVYPGVAMKQAIALAGRLVEVGLWERRDDGWQIHDYHDYQSSAADVLAARQLRAVAGKVGGHRSGEARREARRKQTGSKVLHENGKQTGSKVLHESGKQTGSKVLHESLAFASCADEANANPNPNPNPNPKKEKPEKRRASSAEPDDAFIAALKANPAYLGIDVDREIGKLRAWLLTPRGRGKRLTRQRLVNWLNRCEPTMRVPEDDEDDA